MSGHALDDVSCYPFLERGDERHVAQKMVLGGRFRFESTSRELLALVDAAYAGLPQHRLLDPAPDFQIELKLVPARTSKVAGEPPAVRMQFGAGLLCGVMDASNYVVLCPGQRAALVVASRDMLDHPYHVRYELIEFAVFTLATRGLGLVPLHAACVGRDGRGLLLIGASGSGKSTLALHSLLGGLDFLAEDAVFVEPESMLATGVANFLHVMPDAPDLIDNAAAQQWLEQAPMIRRRSGVEKHEADLRLGPGKVAADPLALVGAVFVSREQAGDPRALLQAVPAAGLVERLAGQQPYAASQPGWPKFQDCLLRRGAYVLRRGPHPRAAVDALLTLLG